MFSMEKHTALSIKIGFAKLDGEALNVGGVKVTKEPGAYHGRIRVIARHHGRTFITECNTPDAPAVVLLLAAEARNATGCPYCGA